MKITNDKPIFDDGLFLDYFLNRVSKEEFSKSFEIPLLHRMFIKLETLFDLLKYALFNDTTNSAGVHFLLLGAKCLTKNINLKGYGLQEVSIEGILSNHTIVSYHLNPLIQDSPNLMAMAIKTPSNSKSSITIFPIQINNTPNSTATCELVIFAMPDNAYNNIIYSLLLDSFKYCKDKNFRYAIISAHNAYELSAKQYFNTYFNSLTLNQQAKKFIERFDKENISTIAIKYLPLVTSITGKPMPPQQILDNIYKLTKYRNNLAHSLHRPSQTEITNIKNCVLSAFFICKYFELCIPHQDYPRTSYYSTLKNNQEYTEFKKISIWK